MDLSLLCFVHKINFIFSLKIAITKEDEQYLTMPFFRCGAIDESVF